MNDRKRSCRRSSTVPGIYSNFDLIKYFFVYHTFLIIFKKFNIIKKTQKKKKKFKKEKK